MMTLFLRTFLIVCLLAPAWSVKAQLVSTFNGVVFRDLDGNGTKDVGEDGIPGVLVELVGGTDDPFNVRVQRAQITEDNGEYSFSKDDLPDASDYRLRFYYPNEAFDITTPGVSTSGVFATTANFTVSSNSLNEEIDLGLEPAYETASHSTLKPLAPTNWPASGLFPLELPQSPVGYGVLTGVKLYINYHVLNPNIEMSADAGETNVVGSVQTSARFNLMTPFDENPYQHTSAHLSEEIDLEPSESYAYGDLHSALGGQQHSYGAPYLGNFVGDGDFSVGVSSTGLSGFLGSGNYSGSISTQSAVGIFVVYIYEEGSLPVNLINFTARAESNTSLLSWSTTEETNSAAFDIEHSGNGANWTKIGSRSARGESSTRVDYTFSDPNPLAGLNYYRLKMIDRDGSFEYSSFVSVKIAFGREAVQGVIFPNPSSEAVFLKNLEETQIAGVTILSPAGTTIAGNLKYDKLRGIDIKGLSSGLYLLKYRLTNGEEKTLKFFVKQQ